MQAGIGLVVVVFAVLLAIAPLGIWNRLIKIHRDAEKRAAEQKAANEKTHKLLALIANELSKQV